MARILRRPLGPGQPTACPVPSSAGFLLSVPNCASAPVASVLWPSLLPAPTPGPAKSPASSLTLLDRLSPAAPRWLLFLQSRHRGLDAAIARPHPAGRELPTGTRGPLCSMAGPQHREPGLDTSPRLASKA